MTSAEDTFKKMSPWMRLSICINIHVKKALIDVLHNHIRDRQVQGLPSDPAHLYAFLQTNKKKIQNSKVIKEQQKSILLPASVQPVNSSSFDVSLTRFLIQTFCGIRNARGDWREPDTTDQTICAYVYRAAAMRNTICHDNHIEEMNATEFEKKWKELEEILQGLKYAEDIGPFKKEELDIAKYKDVILEEFNDYLRSYKEEGKKEKSHHIERRFAVDGNENDIVATELDFERLLQDNDCVFIHGDAGMGKSSTAKRLKNEWCNGNVFDNQNIIYYDSKRINKQLKYKSNVAALAFSEMRDHLTEKRRTIELDDLSMFYCAKPTFDNLIIVIDGIDEFPVKELITEDYVNILERKVLKNEEISGAETITAIYFGYLFPYLKIILLGRNGEFESLKKVQVKRDAAIFNRETKDLELLEFDNANIKDFTCLKICKHQSLQTVCTGQCQEMYNKIKNMELCKNPADLNSLIELQKKHPDENIGNITRTKLLIATISNRLTNIIKHQNNFTVKTFREMYRKKEFSKYFRCIRTLGEISFGRLLENNITVRVEEEIDDGISYFEDISRNKIRIERETLEELDIFYVRDLEYYFVLEPYHTLNIEFLCACYFFSHFDKWDSILKLSKDRQLVIIRFIAGLHAGDYFTKDFVKYVLNTPSSSLGQFFTWLYDVENVRGGLPDGGGDYYRWFGLMENQKLSPSFFLLDYISQEVEIPQSFIPTETIVCYCDYSRSFEWYYMDFFKHTFLTKLSDKLNIESFLKKFPSFKFIIKGYILIDNSDKFNRLDSANNLITFKIDELLIDTPLDSWFSSHFNVNTLLIGWECDSRTITIMLNALSPPPTNTSSSNIYHNNLNNYKVIYPRVPFVRKENYSRDSKQSMFFNFYEVNFTQFSSEVFANTFPMIPSLTCLDDEYIPSSHWLSLSQTDDCRLTEMRIWNPRSKNFKHFLNIKTRVSQFICYSKDDLKQLLNHIVNDQNIQFDKQIKVFVVKVDLLGNRDHYEEITLFSGKTIKEYEDNYSSDNLRILDNIPVPFRDGEQHLNWWCCEISLPFQGKTELSPKRKDNNLLWLGLGLALGLGLLLKYRSMR